MTVADRYRVYRRMARTIEHRAYIGVICVILMLSGIACITAAMCIDTPQIYLVNGISRVREVLLTWL